MLELYFNHLWASPILDDNENVFVDDNDVDSIDLTALEIEQEQILIEEVLMNSKRRIKYRSAVATPKEFINAQNCTIAHFSMHGWEGCIGLEYPCEPYTDQIGEMHVEHIQGVKAFGESFNPFLVFMAACNSESIGNAFVTEIGVPHVVAIDR